MLCYAMTRILGTDGDTKGKRSPGVYCTSLGRLGGIKLARRTDGRRGRANCAYSRASLWTAPAVTISPGRGNKSGSPLGDEVAQGTGAQAGVSGGDSGISGAGRYCRKKCGLDRFSCLGRKGATATGWG